MGTKTELLPACTSLDTFCGHREYTQEVMSFRIEPSAQLLIWCLCAAGSQGRCKLLVLRYLSLRLHDGGPQASLTGKWRSAPPETHALLSKGWVQLPVEAELSSALSETHAHRKQGVQMLAGWWSSSWIWMCWSWGGVQDGGESFFHRLRSDHSGGKVLVLSGIVEQIQLPRHRLVYGDFRVWVEGFAVYGWEILTEMFF